MKILNQPVIASSPRITATGSSKPVSGPEDRWDPSPPEHHFHVAPQAGRIIGTGLGAVVGGTLGMLGGPAGAAAGAVGGAALGVGAVLKGVDFAFDALAGADAQTTGPVLLVGLAAAPVLIGAAATAMIAAGGVGLVTVGALGAAGGAIAAGIAGAGGALAGGMVGESLAKSLDSPH